MKQVVMNIVYMSNKQHKQICDTMGDLLMQGNPHVVIFDKNGLKLLEVNHDKNNSSGVIGSKTILMYLNILMTYGRISEKICQNAFYI